MQRGVPGQRAPIPKSFSCSDPGDASERATWPWTHPQRSHSSWLRLRAHLGQGCPQLYMKSSCALFTILVQRHILSCILRMRERRHREGK